MESQISKDLEIAVSHLDHKAFEKIIADEFGNRALSQSGNKLLNILINKRSERGVNKYLDVPTPQEINSGKASLISTCMGMLIVRRRDQKPGLHEKTLEMFEEILKNGVIPSSENAVLAMKFKELDCLKLLIQSGAHISCQEIMESASDPEACRALADKAKELFRLHLKENRH